MQSLVTRAVGVLAAAGVAVGLAAVPAAAAGPTFDLSARGVTAYGRYDVMMSIPERPVPPIQIRGTLAVTRHDRCGVIQLAENGPADGIEWRTLRARCGRGTTTFRARTGYLWGGATPGLRLCSGRTVRRAELARQCDVHQPAAAR
ncbi:hypothetical protein [Actinoplanes sp. NPDC049599]|uniref:hypothetical protein n=1 Tax=Actinoplanes sp. NPDC049599 TaxID=3363903 RepID=UPI0037A7DE1D